MTTEALKPICGVPCPPELVHCPVTCGLERGHDGPHAAHAFVKWTQ